MFEDPGWNIDNYLKEKGETTTVINEDNVLEILEKDLGEKKT